jgi:hypothetical protein
MKNHPGFGPLVKKLFSLIREFYYYDLAFFILSKHGLSQKISEEPGGSKLRVFITQTAGKQE